MTSQGIHTRALLVRLRAGYWDAKIEDKAVSRDTRQRLGSKKGRWIKDLLPGSEEFVKVRKAYNDLRTWFYTNTLPWEDRGHRLRSTKNFEKFAQTMNRKIRIYEESVQELEKAYPQLIYKAKQDLGQSWRAEDYPHPSKIAEKYWATVSYLTIPHVDDLRVSLDKDQKDIIQAQIEDSTKTMMAGAMQDCWKRLYDVTEKMASTLGNPKAKFKDSLVGNIEDLTSLLPDLNITDDPHLAQLGQEMKKRLASYDPDKLRKDDRERLQAAQAASQVLGKIKQHSQDSQPEPVEGTPEESIDDIMAKMGGVY